MFFLVAPHKEALGADNKRHLQFTVAHANQNVEGSHNSQRGYYWS